MATYRITAQDGNEYDVTAPDDASQEDVLAYAKQNYSTPAEKPAQEQSTLDQIGRQAGLTARYGIEGLGDVVGIVQNPLSVMTGGAIPRAQDVYPALATRIGLPQPETQREQLIGAASRGVVGAGTMAGAGGALAQAPSMIGKAGEVLAAQPAMQVTSAAGGAGAAKLAEQKGKGAGGQLAAGLAGSFAPSSIATIGKTAAMIPSMLKGTGGKYVVPPSQLEKPTQGAPWRGSSSPGPIPSGRSSGSATGGCASSA